MGRPSNFLGWLPDPGPPFHGPLLVPYLDRPIVLIGPNGYGKTRLLQAIVDRNTPRVFSALPRRLAPYLTLERAGIERGRRSIRRTDRELFEAAEAIQAQDDDHDWWRTRLDAAELCWVVVPAPGGGAGALHAVRPDDPFTALARVPASAGHLDLAVEPWVRPDEIEPSTLDAETLHAFRRWANAVLTAGSVAVTIPANPLVAVVGDGSPDSLLPLAEAFCTLLAARTTRRLQILAGFALQLRCLAVENFAWQVDADSGWMPLAHASRAVRRWCTLAATETLRELQQSAAEAESNQTPADPARALARTLGGDLDRSLVPPGEPGAFATRSAWVAMDEPEVNLFAPEARHLAETLATRGSKGRTLIATHSLELAARFVGSADFLMFDAAGRYTLDRPERGIAALLSRLSAYGPGALAATRVLYVEGDWDVELLERLHGRQFTAANVVLSRMHGVKGAGIAASSVWQRMTSTSFGMMFDQLTAAAAQERWTAVRRTAAEHGRGAAVAQLRAELRTARGRVEDVELLRLFASVLEGGIEDRLRLVLHGLSDIFQVLHPSLFGLTAPTWAAAGYDGRSSFKRFCADTTGTDLTDGRRCRRLVNDFDAAGHPVEPAAAAALHRAVTDFITAA